MKQLLQTHLTIGFVDLHNWQRLGKTRDCKGKFAWLKLAATISAVGQYFKTTSTPHNSITYFFLC
jgi:hypothetical protein